VIDSISFRVPGGYAPDLENRTVYRDDYYRGKLGNMRVTQYPDGVYCTGSLAGYLQGSNVLPLTRRTVEEALEKLEKETGWNLNRAELFQVEIGTTLQVENPACMYLSSWGNLPRYTKQTFQKRELETVSYITAARSFTGYDKRKQGESKGQEIPAILSGAELIRLELKYKRGLKQRMGRQLTPWDLADRATYTELVNRWQDFYFRIPKGRIPVLDISGAVSPKDIDNALKAYGLQALGYDTASGFIGTLERRGMLGRVQAARARKAMREAAGDSKISHADNLTAELDSRVREVAVYAR
jgi:hypothetical protein